MAPLSLADLTNLSYAGMALFLFGSAFFLPVPEELTLLGTGYLVATGVLNPWLAIPIAISAMAGGDSLLFFLAKAGSPYAGRLRTRINKLGLERTWIFSPSHPTRAVFLLRFVTGLRFISPIYAGFEQASWRNFLIANLGCLILFVPVTVWLGATFHASILTFTAEFELVRHLVFAVILALAGVGILSRMHRLVRRKKDASE